MWLCLSSTIVGWAPDISTDRIKTYLEGKASPLVLSAETLRTEGRRYGVDPRLVIAISGAETSFGKTTCTQFNAWNWFWCRAGRNPTCTEADRCKESPYASWDAGIRNVTKYMKQSYFEQFGATTIPEIGKIYCGDNSSCEDWVPNVRRFYATELDGDENDLTFR